MVSVAWGAFAAMFGPTLYLGVRWKRATPQGAIAGLIAGIIIGGVFGVLNLTVFADDPILTDFNIAAIGTVIGAIAMIIVSLLTKPVESPIFSHFKNKKASVDTTKITNSL